MICLHGQGSTYYEHSARIEITVPDSATNLKKLCNDDTNILNSRKVIKKFIVNLKNIEQYRKAEIHLNKQAATLNLIFYDWNTRPTMQSYLLENMILDYYNTTTSCSEFVDIEIPNVLSHISSAVYNPVNDPKGIQGI
ncbi:hypothetical protein CLOBL_52970 [Clostridium sp. BL-8]|nr:hypothetical protein CLOBL_52970 [Clostridium sp. BL-8]